MIDLTNKKRNELFLGEAKGIKERYDELSISCKEIEPFLENEEITVKQYREYQGKYDLLEDEMNEIESFFEETYGVSFIEDEYNNNDLEFETEEEIEDKIREDIESSGYMLENTKGVQVFISEVIPSEDEDCIDALITCVIEHEVSDLSEYINIDEMKEVLKNTNEYEEDFVSIRVNEDDNVSIYCNDTESEYHFGWDTRRSEWNVYNERDSYYIFPLTNRYYYHGKKLVVYGDFVDSFVISIDELKTLFSFENEKRMNDDSMEENCKGF